MLFASGCNIIGPAAYLAGGPPKVDAKHQLADVPTVVYIDDRRNLVNPISLRRTMADKTSEALMVNKVLTSTISSQDAMAVATQHERNSQIMSMEELGQAVGAQQVIYVEMVQFQDTPDGFTPRPMAACRVRVIDVVNRKRVFPPPDSQDSSLLVPVMAHEVDSEVYRTRAGRLQVFDMLAKQTGEEIAKVFYKHEAQQLGGHLNPR